MTYWPTSEPSFEKSVWRMSNGLTSAFGRWTRFAEKNGPSGTIFCTVVENWRAVLPYAVLAVLFIFTWAQYAANIPHYQAYSGFTPFEWLVWRADPERFAQDFSNGFDYAKSSFMWLYIVAHEVLGLPADRISQGVIGIELALVVYALSRFSQTILPERSPVALVAIIASYWLTNALTPNLAYFGTPFAGLYYNAATAFWLLSVEAFFGRRYLRSGALMGLTFTIHPIYGMMGGLGLLMMALLRTREILSDRDWSVAGGAAAYTLIAAGWLTLVVGPSSVAGGAIPDDDWYFFTKLTNFHWYPVTMGFFTSEADHLLLPFVAFLLAAIYFWSRSRSSTDVHRLTAGLAVALLVLTAAGIVVSVWPPHTALVKVAMHRASLLLLVVGLVYVVAGLVRDLTDGNAYRRLSCVVGLWAIFNLQAAYHLVPSLLIVAPAWVDMVRTRSRRGRSVAILSVALVSVALGYYAYGYTDLPYLLPSFLAKRALWVPLLIAIIVYSSVRFAPNGRTRAASYLLPLALVAYWYLYGLVDQTTIPSSQIKPAVDFKDAQAWAAENTPPESLFIPGPPPVPVYAWRALSQRPSFGTFREWIYLWSYTSDSKSYERGIERLSLLGVDWTEERFRPRGLKVGYSELLNALKASLLSKDPDWFSMIERKFGVDYLIIGNADLQEGWCFAPVFRNDSFTIMELSSPCGQYGQDVGRN